MKDFHADSGDRSFIYQGSSSNGSAFYLPNTLSLSGLTTGIGSLLGLSSLALLLRPWRILRGFSFRGRGTISSLLSWGRLASLLLAAALFVAPTAVQQAIPEWRQLAIFCVIVSGISVLSAISRCCGSAITCAFWVCLTLFLGEKSVGFNVHEVAQSPMTQLSSLFTGESQAVQVTDQWEDMVTGAPVAKHHVVALPPRPAIKIDRKERKVSAQTPTKGVLDNLSGNLIQQISSSVGAPMQMLGLSSAVRHRDWQDGEAFPDSAYFGSPAMVSAAVDSGVGGTAGPIDQIVSKVSSFIK